MIITCSLYETGVPIWVDGVGVRPVISTGLNLLGQAQKLKEIRANTETFGLPQLDLIMAQQWYSNYSRANMNNCQNDFDPRPNMRSEYFSEPLGNSNILYVNGIRTSYADFRKSLDELAAELGVSEVAGIYNRSYRLIQDSAEADRLANLLRSAFIPEQFAQLYRTNTQNTEQSSVNSVYNWLSSKLDQGEEVYLFRIQPKCVLLWHTTMIRYLGGIEWVRCIL